MIPDGGRPLLDPDRRYWRSQVNRRVRKARLVRLLGRWGAVLSVNVAVLAVLAVSLSGAFRHLTTTSRLNVSEIRVVGTERTTPAAVREVLHGFEGRNLLDVDLDGVAESAHVNPWVLDASVKRILPHTLVVAVRERTPAALALVRGTLHVVDETGFVMGPLGPGLVHDFPVVTGLGRLAPDRMSEALARGVAILRRLRETNPQWAERISEIDLSRPDRVGIVRAEPGPKIYLDPDHVDRNLDDWLRLQAEVSRRVGDVEYVDLRWSRRIALHPSEPPSSRNE